MDFRILSDFQPTGDQPQAIKEIVSQFENNDSFVTLQGVTGSGKTFTMANAVEQLQRPTLVLAHNKTLAAQLYSEFKQFFPNNAVEYFVSYYDYYQPEAYIPTSGTYIEKDLSINEEIERISNNLTGRIQELTERYDTPLPSIIEDVQTLTSNTDEYLKKMGFRW